MAPASKNLVEGAVCAVAGVALFLFAGDISIPVFTLTKVGVVLIVIGAIQVLYGAYLALGARGGE